jgi:hypothetical protein
MPLQEHHERLSSRDAETTAAYDWQSPFLAEGIETLRAIGRLRYELFIERDGKKYEHADHRNRLFLEPVDFVSLNFSAGTPASRWMAVRLTRAEDVMSDRHLNLIVENCGLDEQQLARTVITSRFAVRDDNDAKLQIPNVWRDVYEAGLRIGAEYCLLAARKQVLALFTRFGFVRVGEPYVDPVAGVMQVMRLDALDRQHLLASHSPYLKSHDRLLGVSAPHIRRNSHDSRRTEVRDRLL